MDPQNPYDQPPAAPPPQPIDHTGSGEVNPIQHLLHQSQQADQPPQHSDPQAVDFVRSKIDAIPAQAYVPPPFAAPAAPPQQPPLAPARQTEPPQPAAPAVAPVAHPSTGFMPKQQFGTFQLPEEDEPEASAPTAHYEAVTPAPAAVEPTEEPPAPQPQIHHETVVEARAQPVATVEPEAISANVPTAPAAAPPEPSAQAHVSTKKASLIDKFATTDKGLIATIASGVKHFYTTNKPKLPSRIKPLVGAFLTGSFIFLLFNSQVIVGQIQYLTSSGNQSANIESPQSTAKRVSAANVIIIPKINVKVPVIYDEPSFSEAKVQKALERGVVHYGTTARPGQSGNNVIVGHSANNWWAAGGYKYVFTILGKLNAGDTFALHYHSRRYVYKVFEKKIVTPNDVSVLSQDTETPITTLITCTPPGSSWRRLIIRAKQISPNPAVSKPTPANNSSADARLPGNPPSLWQQIKERLFGG